jgi:hypothetical protein
VISFREFSDNMLKAVFEENRRAHDFVDLSTIPQKYGFAGDREWVQDWAEAHSGYLKFEQGSIASPPHPLMARISGGGRLHVEATYGDKDGVPPLFDDIDFSPATSIDGLMSRTTSDEPSIVAHDPEPILSETWTGRTLSAVQKIELVQNIDAALGSVAGLTLSQEKASQVRSLLLAARTLSEAPDPPLDIIKLIFGNVDRLIGIAGFFVGLAGLIAGSI